MINFGTGIIDGWAPSDIIRNNTVVNTMNRDALQATGIFIWGDAANNKVYNNTIQNALTGIQLNSLTINNLVKNNIFWRATVDINNQGTGNILSNNLCPSGGAACPVTTNPQFVNESDPVDPDLHLQSTSPARDAGATLSDVLTDFDEVSRPQGSSYDIGAYEFITSAAVSLTVNPTTVSPGGSVTVTWSNVASPTINDWLGIYAQGTADTSYLNWVYTSSCTMTTGITAKASGSCSMTMPLTAGTYEIRLFSNGGYTKLATSPAITVTLASSGPIAYYKLDETSGFTASDSAGTNPGSLVNGPIWQPTGGQIAGALAFNGVDDAVSLTNLPVSTIAGDNTTVAFWMYWNGGQSGFAMPFGFNLYDLAFESTTNSFGFNSANSDLWGIPDTGLAGRWVHVAAVFTNGVLSSNDLYMDGVKQTLTQRKSTSGSRTVSVQSVLTRSALS
ncbi:MAG: choice-of-anchor Q domain-containing protein, partial [Chloroflexota bacterium]